MTIQIFNIKGMHCASCASVIGGRLKKMAGIKKAEVNFATETVRIEFDENKIDLNKMNEELAKLGYTLSLPQKPEDRYGKENHHHGTMDDKERELEQAKIKTQFIVPVAILIFLIMMWDILAQVFPFVPNLPLPMELSNIIFLIIATVSMFWIGQPFIKGVGRFIRYRVADMDTLIGIGTLSAYLYSVVITLFWQVREAIGVPEYTYFDVTIVVIGFVTLGKYLEARSRMKTGQAIEKLISLQAKTAIVIRNGKELEIPINEVLVGDIIAIKPGSKIPTDGEIIEGNSAVDESMITGEPVPVDKKNGDKVIGATINKQGYLKFKAQRVGTDTMLAQIVKTVQEAQGSKAPIQALADRISAIFVPIVLIIAFTTLVIWLVFGISSLGTSVAISYAILSSMGVLVIACPCALGLATPTAIIVGVGKGAEYGILIKNAESLEKLGKVDTVVFDKTGTITKGTPEVSEAVSYGSLDENEILKLSASVEKLSEHPLALAIVNEAAIKNLAVFEAVNFTALEGFGVKGTVQGKEIYIRKPGEKDIDDKKIQELQEQGKTVVIVEINGVKQGLIALSDVPKEQAKETIESLRKMGIKTVMLTGDNPKAAHYIANQVGIDDVIAQVFPQEKSGKIKELQSQGRKVAMAGDGINDAPALVQADVGIAMATGTDIAIESAGIAILRGDIKKIYQAIKLARATMATVKQNLFWAFIYNLVGIPIAAGVLYPIWGIILNPIFAGLAMAFSSVSVVTNSLRLRVKKL